MNAGSVPAGIGVIDLPDPSPEIGLQNHYVMPAGRHHARRRRGAGKAPHPLRGQPEGSHGAAEHPHRGAAAAEGTPGASRGMIDGGIDAPARIGGGSAEKRQRQNSGFQHYLASILAPIAVKSALFSAVLASSLADIAEKSALFSLRIARSSLIIRVMSFLTA